MLRIFNRNEKDDNWIISVKGLKAKRLLAYKVLTQKEIKERILECESIGQRSARFEKRTISKQDKKDLKRLGYHVKEFKYSNGRVDITIFWD